jgi:hypothetical protein
MHLFWPTADVILLEHPKMLSRSRAADVLREGLMDRNWTRLIFAAAAMLAASGCSYGSMVDIAPMQSRLSQPLLAPGDYCEVKGEAPPFTVVSSQDCVPVSWNADERTLTVVIEDDPVKTADVAIVSLGSGMHAAQFDDSKAPAPHQISLLIARGDAFVMLPMLDDEKLTSLARTHRKVVLKTVNGHPYIAAGRVTDVKAFLKAAGRTALRLAKSDDDLAPGVRDVAGSPDHVATPEQVKDIEAVLKAVRKLRQD